MTYKKYLETIYVDLKHSVSFTGQDPLYQILLKFISISSILLLISVIISANNTFCFVISFTRKSASFLMDERGTQGIVALIVNFRDFYPVEWQTLKVLFDECRHPVLVSLLFEMQR